MSVTDTGLTSRAIIGRFFARLEQELGQTWSPRLAMPFQSDQASEEYKWLGMAPAMREWVGARMAKGLRDSGITIRNKTFEGTLAVSVDEKRRDKTGQIQVRIDELAQRAAAHPMKLLSTLIGAGLTDVCYDGQLFFDIDHREDQSGTQLNLLAAAQVDALDIETATTPTEAEMALAILGVISYMMGYKDDQGEPMNELAREFIVMVPVPLFPSAYAAASKNVLHGASGNTTDNILKSGAFKIDVVVNPRLAWTTTFCVFRADAPAKPFIWQEELPLQMQAIAEGSELEFNQREHHYGIEWIGNCGFGYWQYAAHATLS